MYLNMTVRREHLQRLMTHVAGDILFVFLPSENLEQVVMVMVAVHRNPGRLSALDARGMQGLQTRHAGTISV